jgi:GT2 family glycosyltransferase
MSRDGTREKLKIISMKYDQVKILDNPSSKTPVARNIGVKAATGDYIAILDAHAEYEENYLYSCVKILEKDSSIAAAGCPYNSKGRTVFGKATALAMSHFLGVGNAKHRYPDFEGFAEGAHFPVYRKEVFARFGLFDERLIRNQDDEFNFRLTLAGLKSYIFPSKKTIYYVRESPKKLFIQYYQYGFWRIAVLYKHKIPISFRQFVPTLFLFFMFLMFIVSFFLPVPQILTIFIIPIIYLTVLSIFAIGFIFKHGFLIGILFPISLMVMHFAYGFGFIAGIFSKSTRIR